MVIYAAIMVAYFDRINDLRSNVYCMAIVYAVCIIIDIWCAINIYTLFGPMNIFRMGEKQWLFWTQSFCYKIGISLENVMKFIWARAIFKENCWQ